MRLFFSTEGRIPRYQWWIGVVALTVFNFIVFWILWRSYGESVILNPGTRTLVFLISLPLLYIAFCVAAKRFHDRGKSAWFAGLPALVSLLNLVLDLFHVTGDPWVPTGLDTMFLIVQIGIGLWFLVELGFLTGSPHRIDYGPDPLRPETTMAPPRTAMHPETTTSAPRAAVRYARVGDNDEHRD